jgi:hypothetical protein
MASHEDGTTRRKVLECMTWAGTGLLWSVSGGVPRSLGLVDGAMAAEVPGLTFLQISDSHMGFDKPANPNAKGTLEEAIGRIKAIPRRPAFITYQASTTSSTRTPSSIRSGMAAVARATAGTASTPAACTSSAWSTSRT